MQEKMKVCILVGTRPEIIKMSPIIRECGRRGIDFFILHTGQHYSYGMDKVFFEDLGLPDPLVNLDVGSGTQAVQTAKILAETEAVLIREDPGIILVQGDTNSVLAGALAASKIGVKVGHVEAGLRSYDRGMPEELNRIVADHISDLLFCPSAHSERIVLSEGIGKEKVFVTGNTIVDAVLQNVGIAESRSSVLKRLGLKKKEFILVTAHRPSNVDSRSELSGVFEALARIQQEFDVQVVYPIHPRTRKMVDSFRIAVPEGISLVDPVPFLDFLALESGAKLILTDSGGVQEEACILKVPCVTMRDNTERPETVEIGANRLAGNSPEKILSCAKAALLNPGSWENPYGDGSAAARIVDIILDTSS